MDRLLKISVPQDVGSVTAGSAARSVRRRQEEDSQESPKKRSLEAEESPEDSAPPESGERAQVATDAPREELLRPDVGWIATRDRFENVQDTLAVDDSTAPAKGVAAYNRAASRFKK